MKIYTISILKNFKKIDSNNELGDSAIFLSKIEKLGHINFFIRSSVKEFLKFATRELFIKALVNKPRHVSTENMGFENRTSLEEFSTCVVHTYKSENGLGAVMITDNEYSSRIAFTLLKQITEEFSDEMVFIKKNIDDITKDSKIKSPFLNKIMESAQDPTNIDSISSVNKNMDETIRVIHETIDKVLERGTKLEDMVSKTEDLSLSSKLFYKEAKRSNECCNLM
jgi:synaptobrevin family protein YKT6